MESFMEEEDLTEEIVEVPFHLPRLFVAPSCLPDFTKIVAEVADMKTRLSAKLIQLRESTQKKDEDRMKKLHRECCWLRLEIYGLQNEAAAMRKELVRRIYLEVRSAKEMMAVNELKSAVGVGATAGMRRFGGNICMAANLPEDVIKAIKIANRCQKTF